MAQSRTAKRAASSSSPDATEKAATNTEVDASVVHDRVAMLSLRADGTPDQHNPEIIGDKRFATEATKRQFAEQAVSAADDAQRDGVASDAEAVEQDPTIAARQQEHQEITEAAEQRAESVVDQLHQG